MLPVNMFHSMTKAMWRSALKEMKVSPRRTLPFLGQGVFAKAWALGKYRVIKVTTDDSDGKALDHFRKYPHPCVVKVHQLFKIQNFYVAVLSRLKKISVKSSWHELLWNRLNIQHASSETIKNSLSEMSKYEKDEYKVEIAWVRKYLKFKAESGFVSTDLHWQNIMLDARGQLRVSDLGCSKGSSFYPNAVTKELSIPSGHSNAPI